MDMTIQKNSLPFAIGLSFLWLLTAANVFRGPVQPMSAIPAPNSPEPAVSRTAPVLIEPIVVHPNGGDVVESAVNQSNLSAVYADQLVDLLPQWSLAHPAPSVANQTELLPPEKTDSDKSSGFGAIPESIPVEKIVEPLKTDEKLTNVIVIQSKKLSPAELAKLIAEKKKVELYAATPAYSAKAPAPQAPQPTSQQSAPPEESPSLPCPDFSCVPLPSLTPFVYFQPMFVPVVYYQPVVFVRPLIPVYFVQPVPIVVSPTLPVWCSPSPTPVPQFAPPAPSVVMPNASQSTPVLVNIIPSTHGAPTFVFSNGVRMKPTFFVPGQPIRNRVRGITPP